jgi:hypothetical protein
MCERTLSSKQRGACGGTCLYVENLPTRQGASDVEHAEVNDRVLGSSVAQVPFSLMVVARLFLDESDDSLTAVADPDFRRLPPRLFMNCFKTFIPQVLNFFTLAEFEK